MHPEEDVRLRFLDLSKMCIRDSLCIPFNFPELRQKAKFAAIPSTSGTATEVTAFSVITNYQTGVKYPLADFNITPDVAIVDPDLVACLLYTSRCV